MSATFENIMDRVEHCYTAKPCVECKYDKRDFPHCVGRLLSDVRFFYKQLESRLAQVERERDAAVEFLKKVGCEFCNHAPSPNDSYISNECFDCVNNSNFELRGVCPEAPKEQKT